MMYMLIGAAALFFAVGFGAVWFVTRYINLRWLRMLVRATGVAIFWTPVQHDGAGYWWPLFFNWADLAAVPDKGVAIASVLLVIGVLWALGMAMAPEPNDPTDT